MDPCLIYSSHLDFGMMLVNRLCCKVQQLAVCMMMDPLLHIEFVSAL